MRWMCSKGMWCKHVQLQLFGALDDSLARSKILRSTSPLLLLLDQERVVIWLNYKSRPFSKICYICHYSNLSWYCLTTVSLSMWTGELLQFRICLPKHFCIYHDLLRGSGRAKKVNYLYPWLSICRMFLWSTHTGGCVTATWRGDMSQFSSCGMPILVMKNVRCGDKMLFSWFGDKIN